MPSSADGATRDIDVALKNREFEIQLFWQRANYFLVLITALGIGVFSIDEAFLGFLISVFGVVVCRLWFRTNLGSRFWQVFWENEVESLSPQYNINSFQKSTSEIRAEMKEKISHSEKRSAFRKWVDRRVLEKPSVTHSMISLSFFAMLFWGVLALYHLFELVAEIGFLVCGTTS